MRVSPTPKPSAGHDASWQFADTFAPQPEAATEARHIADAFGLTPVSPGVASTLTVLAKAIRARAVVEIGTGTGVSALSLFAGMDRDGILTSIDIESEHQHEARRIVTGTGIKSQRFRLIAGPALTVLPKLSDGAYDLVFIDADRLEYQEYAEQGLRLLRSGGILAVHHALLSGTVADPTRDDDETLIVREAIEAIGGIDDLTTVLLPIGDGLLVSVTA